MIRLALLRHGHTAWNRAGRVQGRTDIPLDESAVAELGAQRLPAPWSSAALVSSPLERAVQTARLISAREPQTHPALMEMNWGDWEGRVAHELRTDPTCDHRDIGTWGWTYTPLTASPLPHCARVLSLGCKGLKRIQLPCATSE